MGMHNRVEDFFDRGLEAGQRVYCIKLSGLTKVPERLALVKRMLAVLWKNDGKPADQQKNLWDIFKIELVPDPQNEHDPFAVKVMIVRKVKGESVQTQIGFIPANDNGDYIGHNKAVFKWLANEKVLRTVILNIEEDEGFTWALLGVITEAGTTALPKKCKPITGYVKEGKAPVVPAHEGTAPVALSSNYPPLKDVDDLITAHSEFEEYFGWQEIEDGETFTVAPVFLSQWVGDPQKFGSIEQLRTYAGKHRCYGTLEEAKNLTDIEKEYGPVMASNYYRFSGCFEGPFTKPHTREVLQIMATILRTIRESPLIQAREQ